MINSINNQFFNRKNKNDWPFSRNFIRKNKKWLAIFRGILFTKSDFYFIGKALILTSKNDT